MKRKKINSLIAFSVAFSSFNLVAGDSLLTLASTGQVQESQKDTNEESYYEKLYKKYNKVFDSKNISNSSKDILDNSYSANKSNLSNLFKVQLSNNANCTLLDCYYNDKSKDSTINLPESNSIYTNSNLSIIPDKDIEELTIKYGESYLNYKNLAKNTYHAIKDFDMQANKSFEVFIKYADKTPLVSQTFNVKKIKNDDFTINNVKVDYKNQDNKVIAELSFEESSKNNLLVKDESAKKVYFAGKAYDVKTNDSKKYYTTIDVTDFKEVANATIYSCNNIYQVSSVEKEITNPYVRKTSPNEASDANLKDNQENKKADYADNNGLKEFSILKNDLKCDYKLVSSTQRSFKENNNYFNLFKDSCTIALDTSNNLSSFGSISPDITIEASNNTGTNGNNFVNNSVTAKITKLENYSDDKQDKIDETQILSSAFSSYTFQEEGYYKVVLTAQDDYGNKSEDKTLYVAVSKGEPKVTFDFFKEDQTKVSSISPNDTVLTDKVTPVINVKGVALVDKNNNEANIMKGNEKTPLLKTENTKYGEVNYVVNDDDKQPVYFENTKLSLECVQNYFSFDENYKPKKVNLDAYIESDKPTVNATAKINNETKNIDGNSVLHLNELPELTFTANNMIKESTLNSEEIMYAENIDFSVTNSKGEDCTPMFKLNPSNDPESFTSKFAVEFTEDLSYYNNNAYTFKFNCKNMKGNADEKVVKLVIDTEKPSVILNFFSTDKSEDDLKKDEDGNLIFDDKDHLKIVSDKSLGYLEDENKSINLFCNYPTLYLNVEALDNSSEFNEPSDTLIKDISLISKSQDYKLELHSIDSNTYKLDLSDIKDNIYNLTFNAVDNSGNETKFDNINLFYNRTQPKVSMDFTKGENQYNVSKYDYKIVDDKIYFNKFVKPYINIESSLIDDGFINNGDDLQKYFKINLDNAELDYQNAEIKDNSIRIGLKPNKDSDFYEDGNYEITGTITDLYQNTVTSISTNIEGNKNLPFSVDTKSPLADVYLNSNNGISKLNKYNTETGSFYIAVKEPNLNIDEFLKNEDNKYLKVNYSDDIADPTKVAELKDILIENVTSDISDDAKESLGYDDNTTVFEISNNGESFNNGYYSISYEFNDFAGHTTSKKSDFTIDSEDIEVDEHGFDFSKQYFNSDLDINFDVKEHYSGFSYSNIRLTKDGEDVTDNYITNNFNNNSEGGNINVHVPLNDSNKSTEGKYNLTITIKDPSGREYEKEYSFYMDRTSITLNEFNVNLGDGQVKDEVYYTNASDVNIHFSTSDNLSGEDSRVVKVNGNVVDASNNSISNDYFAKDGEYTINLYFIDKCGNESSYSYKVIVDRTAPEVSLDGFQGVTDPEDGFLYINRTISPQVIVSDNFGEDLGKRTAYLNGSVYASSTITENGHHIYMVDVFDLAGNRSTKEIDFVLDTIAPDINVSDVEDYKYYNKDVTPNYSTSDYDAKLVAYLNGSPFDGGAITGDGEYTLHFVCTDKATNVTEKDVTFYIDTVPPEISVFGINENQVNGILTPTIETDDPTATLTAYLNGDNYYGGEINESGKYVLIVNAIDRAGNSSERIVTFMVDADLPQITFNNIEEAKSYRPGLEPDVSVSKNAEYTMTLNGEAYDGSPLNEEGDYELVVDAVDDVGNKNTASIKFSISNTSETTTLYKNSFNKPDSTGSDDNSTLRNLLIGGISALILLISAFIFFIFFKKRKKEEPEENNNENDIDNNINKQF